MEAQFGTLIQKKLQDELEKVENRAGSFITRNYVYGTGSMTGSLDN